MDTETTTMNETMYDDGGERRASLSSLPTALPAPPRMPSFMPRVVSTATLRPTLRLVASNPTPLPSRATVPQLRVVFPSTPPTPPSIPPTGSTPIRRAA